MANLQPRFHFKKVSDRPEAGTIACFINNSGDLPDFIKKIDKSGVLPHVIAEHNLTNSRNSAVVPLQDDKDFYHLILIGLGEKILNAESYRRMIGQIIRAAEKHKSESVTIYLPKKDLNSNKVVSEAITAATIAIYDFQEYITDEKRKHKVIKDITLITDEDINQNLVKQSEAISLAVNTARSYIDTPPSVLTPAVLAQKAEDIAKKHNNLKCTVFDEPTIISMGMGGLKAVSAASEEECRLVILDYTPENGEDYPTISLVGKGITFDSGGMSIKPANYMEDMKEDMSGAAAVISAMDAIAKLKPAVRVVALAPMSENMVSGSATKPGDIVAFYNGKTAEIRNTDAEGRLILADALAYATKHYKPDVIIDIATLTGACSYALGPFFTGMFSEHDEIAKMIQESGERSGDYVWRLPLTADYAAAVVSPVADLCNIGKKNIMAGATTAACFLQAFVDKTPWVHLDIAGTAFNVPNISYFRNGIATGAGVRLLVDFVINYAK